MNMKVTEPDEEGNVQIVEHILIRDVDTGEVMLNKRPYQKEIKQNEE
jgi:hypothetical protein